MAASLAPPARATPDRVGDAAAVRALQRRRLPLIVALTAAILLLHLLQWGLERAAQGAVEQTRAQLQTLRQETEQTRTRLAAAPQRHPARYLTGVSLGQAPDRLAEAGRALDRASRARHPGEKARGRSAAEAALSAARAAVQAVAGRLDRLEAARTGHAEAAHRLAAAAQDARQTVASLETAGYQSRHFTTPRALIAQAELRSTEVRALQARPAGGDVPYLEIYEKSREGEARAEEARRLARGVEELRRANETRTRDLLDRIASVRPQYDAARVAAARLVLYSAYASVLTDVQRGRAELDAARDAARAAAQRNAMEQQEFREAAGLLSDGERRAGRAADAFAHTLDMERSLIAALAAVALLQDGAGDRLEEARRRIDRYDHIDQDRAERLLRDAATRYRRAQTLRHADPVLATELYRQARSLADQAYSSVRTSEPSSSSGGGGWSGGGSSGPSGGSSGGPSGGSFGGPSGGSVGSGGF